MTIDALTSEESQTTANPDGSFTWTTNLEPVRTKRNGSWISVDTTLKKNADGSVSPAAVPAALTLSGGGSAPLATVSTGGQSLSLTFPVSLPAPTISGDTATYADVLPSVDLQVTDTAFGGFSEVLIVKNSAAAANPLLSTLHMAMATSGVTMAADAGGNLTAKDDAGKPVFTAPTPHMWDSSTASQVPTGLATLATAKAPAFGGKQSVIRVATKPGDIDLIPDASMLTSPTTKFPVYIDPAVAVNQTNMLSAWDGVQQCAPTTSNYNSHANGDPGVGYQGYASACGTGIERGYYQVDMPKTPAGGYIPAGATILPGTGRMHSWVSYAAANGSHTTTVYVKSTGAIGSGTTWNSQPCLWDINAGACSSGGYSGVSSFTTNSNALNPPDVYFDITGALQAAVSHGYPNLTVGLFNATESDASAFVRFATTDHTWFEATYDLPPNQPSGLVSTPLPHNGDTSWSCVNNGWLGASDGSQITLTAQYSSPMPNQPLGANFWLHDNTTGGDMLTKANYGSPSFSNPSQIQMTTSPLSNGHSYSWRTDAYDGYFEGPSSPTCNFTVDQTPPTSPVVSSPQFPHTGTSLKAHSPGVFTVSSTDNLSGVWCYEYAFDGTLAVPSAFNTCTPGVSADGRSGTITGNTINWTPPSWATHDLKVVAVDRAGNTSQPTDYSFYVPDDPNAKPSPGNLTGNGQPDYLTTDANGNLVIYQSDLDPGTGGQIAATPAESPDGTSWATWQVTHRGSMHGLYVDDLLVHKANSTTLYVYYNDGGGHFTRAQSITSLSIQTGTGSANRCSCNFAAATQIVAIGDGDAGTAGADYPLTSTLLPARDVTDFIAVIPDANGVNQEWLFTYKTTGTFDNGRQISNFTTANNLLANLNLYSPGDASGDGLPDLWGTNTTTGAVVQFASARNADGTINWGGIGGANGMTTVATVPAASYNLGTVSSPGNVDANGHVNLWAVDTGNHVVMWRDPMVNGTGYLSTQATAGTLTGPVLSWMLGNGGRPGATAASLTSKDVALTAGSQIGTEYDSSGNNATGTASGNVTEVNAHDGGEANFDGASQISTAGPVVDTSKAFTASVWVNPATLTTSGNHEAVSQDGSLSSAFMLGYAGGPAAWWVYMPNADITVPGGPVVVAPNNSAKAGTWTHLVAAYDPTVAGGTLTLYVNGQYAASTTGVVGFKSVGSLIAGRSQYGGNKVDYWTGGIDDISVFSRALGASEVTSLYDAGRVQPQQPSLLSTYDTTASANTVCTTTPTGAGTVTTLTPTLKATVSDSDTTVGTHADFEMWDATDPTQAQPIVLDGAGSTTANGTGPNVTATAPALTNGHTYGWKVRTVAEDGSGSSVFSQPCYFTVSTDGTVTAAGGAQILLGDNTMYTAAQKMTWTGPKTHMIFQADGNLIVYRNSDGAALWSSNTPGNPSAVLVMQKDGNLVIYNGMPTVAANDWVSGTSLWNANTSGKTNARVVIQNDGNVMMYAPGSGAVWSTNTVTS